MRVLPKQPIGGRIDRIRPRADGDARRLYERDLVLVRPDLHVAWRGDRLPDRPDRLAHVVTGHAGPW